MKAETCLAVKLHFLASRVGPSMYQALKICLFVLITKMCTELLNFVCVQVVRKQKPL